MPSRESNLCKWQQLINDQQSSDLTVTEFCRSRNLSYGQFHKWKRDLKYELKDTFADFTQVEFKEPITESVIEDSLEDFTGIHLQFGNTVRLDLDRNFDIHEFRKTATALLDLLC